MTPTPGEHNAVGEEPGPATAGSGIESSGGTGSESTSGTPAPPDLAESARRLLAEGGDTTRAAAATAQALTALVRAEFALAGAALRRSFWLGLFAAFATLAAILYALAGSVALLRYLGLPWVAAIGVATLLAALIAGLLYWRARRALRLVRFDATRRQLGQLGGEP